MLPQKKVTRLVEVRFDQNMVQIALIDYMRKMLPNEGTFSNIHYVASDPWNFMVRFESDAVSTQVKQGALSD